MSSLLNDIHAEDVAEFLNRNRDFFHVFPNLLNDLSIPHPKTGQEVSLLERQIYQLREQRDHLKVEVETLKDIAGENGILLNKVYQFCQTLLAATDDQAAVDAIYHAMQSIFKVEAIALISWELPKIPLTGMTQLGLSASWSNSLKATLQVDKPRCGLLEAQWQKGLFQTDQPMQSVCIMPLGQKTVWGALALGATTDRFNPELGTYFLKVMAQMISSRLQHLFA